MRRCWLRRARSSRQRQSMFRPVGVVRPQPLAEHEIRAAGSEAGRAPCRARHDPPPDAAPWSRKPSVPRRRPPPLGFGRVVRLVPGVQAE
eukprot:1284348-Prymnesium_polylepis.1